MRRTRHDTAQSRHRIIEAAARLFRRHGPDGVSVADIMSAAGMTHGGFYSHFDSKEALQAAATERAFTEKLGVLREGLKDGDCAKVKRYVQDYLTLVHVRDRGDGCPIAGLALDAERAAEPVKAAMSAGAGATIEIFAKAMAKHASEPRRDAIIALSTMIGTLVLARAAHSRNLQSEIIKAARESDALALFID